MIATSPVTTRTTLLIARFRYHLRTGGVGSGPGSDPGSDPGSGSSSDAGPGCDTLLCEEIVPLACTGAAEAPRWLSPRKVSAY